MSRWLVAFLFLLGATSAQAEFQPQRTVKIVVPYAAGGQTDVLARMLGDELSKKWKIPVIVENIVGASGQIGISNVAQSSPDAHTLLAVPPAFVVNAVTNPKAAGAVSDWEPITIIGSVPYLLIARPSLPVGSVSDLLNLAKGEGTTYASSGVGSSAHLAVLAIEMIGGVKFTHVPYRGMTPAITDVMNSHIDFMIADASSVYELAQDSKLKVLGKTEKSSDARLGSYPMLSESGLPGYQSLSSWTALLAPPKTSRVIAQDISDQALTVLADPSMASRLRTMFISPGSLDAAGTRAFLARESVFVAELAQKVGLPKQ